MWIINFVLENALWVIQFIIMFSALIVIHELGHFWAARASGVKVLEFGVGFGPRIWGWKKGETEYNLNLIPFGGFVRMLGEEEASDDPRSFEQAKLWKRMIITLAGVFMNFLLAIVALTALFTIGTSPILINEGDMKTAYEEGYLGFQDANENTLTWEESQNNPEAQMGWIKPMKKNFLEAIAFSIGETYRISVAVLQKVAEIPGEIIGNHQLPEGMAGPVGIAEVTKQVSKVGILALIKLGALLSISLGVMNLLPIPALDGGRFFFQLVELILKPFGIKPNAEIENYAHVGGFFILISFLVAVTWADITRIFF